MNLLQENAIRSLGAALKADPRVLDMKAKENKMMESEEVLHLSKRLELASEEYSRAISLNDKELIEKTKKALHEAKLNIDLHPLVQEYNEAYIKVRDLYMDVDDIIFGPYRSKIIKGDNEND